MFYQVPSRTMLSSNSPSSTKTKIPQIKKGFRKSGVCSREIKISGGRENKNNDAFDGPSRFPKPTLLQIRWNSDIRHFVPCTVSLLKTALSLFRLRILKTIAQQWWKKSKGLDFLSCRGEKIYHAHQLFTRCLQSAWYLSSSQAKMKVHCVKLPRENFNLPLRFYRQN